MPAPEWVNALTDAVTPHLIAAGPPSPVGAHLQEGGGTEPCEVSLFYGGTEILGGARDGERTDLPFWLDLAGLTREFDRVERLSWQAVRLGPNDDLGPHVAIEGTFEGRPVRVRVLAASPAAFGPARSADTLRGTFVEHW